MNRNSRGSSEYALDFAGFSPKPAAIDVDLDTYRDKIRQCEME